MPFGARWLTDAADIQPMFVVSKDMPGVGWQLGGEAFPCILMTRIHSLISLEYTGRKYAGLLIEEV